ncbi:hypothetical protein KCP76_18435 [Salmonella enterica subsp. enterica serovar Weltevreden]|nr:hypothetical protein KCP76_18435 [Salmonella enterica subsp. enterica serovar Weltevreden]
MIYPAILFIKRGEETPAVSLQLVGPGHYVARPLQNNALSRYNIRTGRVSGEENNMTQFITHKMAGGAGTGLIHLRLSGLAAKDVVWWRWGLNFTTLVV